MVIEYSPHAAQMEIHRARGFRFRTVCTGRRFGKTLCMAAEFLEDGAGVFRGIEGCLVDENGNVKLGRRWLWCAMWRSMRTGRC
jgi:hypothetical protein